MDSVIKILFFILVFASYGNCSDFKQERAKVIFYEPKYLKSITTLTFREGRNSPYLTAVNVTTNVPLGNNITWYFDFFAQRISGIPFRYEFRTCDVLNQNWAKDWLKNYSNVSISVCPVPADTYHFRKFEFPPKNFPLQIGNVDHYAKLSFFITSTKEKIAELAMNLKFNNKKSKP